MPQEPPKELAIEKLALVSQIFGFGAFEPMTTDQLVPGRPLLLYAEVVDFDSRYAGGRFETVLQAQVALETPTGSTITKFDFDPIVDQCGTKRTDFYSHFTFTLPESLTEGRYVLRLRLKDELSGQQAEKAIDFVVSQLPEQL